MDYHTPFLTGELAEDTGIRLDAAQYDDDSAVAAVDALGTPRDGEGHALAPEIHDGK